MLIKMKTCLLTIASLLIPSARAFFISPSMATTVMRVSSIESTPNPSSFKFDLDEKMQGSSRGVTYKSNTSSHAPEPIQRVLELDGVDSVYALGDWLCLNKVPSAKWEAIVSVALLWFCCCRATRKQRIHACVQQYILISIVIIISILL